MKYCFDLDNTLCLTENKDYANCKPFEDRVKIVNDLYDQGHEITIYTARGMGKFKGNVDLVYKEYYELTKNQIEKWAIKHHVLLLGKLSYDHFICDKAYNSEDFFNKKTKIGFVAGAFDVIHPGYVKMFNECKKHCDYLIVGLHTDPNKQNGKLKPILTPTERLEILSCFKNVDEVKLYDTEEDLKNILSQTNITVRFLGDDYINKNYTGSDLNIPIIYINRDHGWSATKFKNLIKNNE
jgi:glycerol-3-phosphate cytidylyltransferase